MSALAIPFHKMNGIGNSILVVDLRGLGQEMTETWAEALAREPALHFDQLMAVREPRRDGTDAFVDIFNTDGSRAGACGNGTRCVAWALLRGSAASEIVVETAGGNLTCQRWSETIFSVDMGPPRFGWQDIPLRDAVADTTSLTLPDAPHVAGADLSRFAAVSMGNPHAVFFVPDSAAIDLASVGPLIEHNPIFPDRVNASFAEIRDCRTIVLRVWERGAGATLACGSAACATAVAAVRAGLVDREVEVRLPGGALAITWRESDGHVIMTGGVELEHSGVLPPVPVGAAA